MLRISHVIYGFRFGVFLSLWEGGEWVYTEKDYATIEECEKAVSVLRKVTGKKNVEGSVSIFVEVCGYIGSVVRPMGRAARTTGTGKTWEPGEVFQELTNEAMEQLEGEIQRYINPEIFTFETLQKDAA